MLQKENYQRDCVERVWVISIDKTLQSRLDFEVISEQKTPKMKKSRLSVLITKNRRVIDS